MMPAAMPITPHSATKAIISTASRACRSLPFHRGFFIFNENMGILAIMRGDKRKSRPRVR